MNEKKPLQEPFGPGELWALDEPGYGMGPLNPFEASYKVDGHTYTVTIQGFFKDDDQDENEEEASDEFRYRVTYKNGAREKILDYTPGIGFIEEGVGLTAHSIAVGECVNEHFSK